jgi:cytochrome P450
MDTVNADVFDHWLHDAGDVRDPYAGLAELRRASPVLQIDMAALGAAPTDTASGWSDSSAPSFVVASYELTHEVLRDAETFSSTVYEQTMGAVMGHTILEMDAPEHLRHRNLVAQGFRQRVLERWKDPVIAAAIHELIDAFAGDGHADLVRQLTFPFPVKVISRILGLPDEDWADFQRWAMEVSSVASDFDRAKRASETLAAYFKPILDERRTAPRDDLISELVRAQVDGHELTDEEIYSFLRLLLPAGSETTFCSSGSLLAGLLLDPAQLDAVRADRSLVPQAIEEALRWEAPVPFIVRRAMRDVSLAGVDVPAGSSLMIAVGAAGRDEAQYPDPDRFDIFRDPKQHMSFGFGPHMCLGMHLARLETAILLNAVLDRLPGLRLDPAADDVHVHGLHFRSPTTLPVVFDVA